MCDVNIILMIKYLCPCTWLRTFIFFCGGATALNEVYGSSFEVLQMMCALVGCALRCSFKHRTIKKCTVLVLFFCFFWGGVEKGIFEAPQLQAI